MYLQRDAYHTLQLVASTLRDYLAKFQGKEQPQKTFNASLAQADTTLPTVRHEMNTTVCASSAVNPTLHDMFFARRSVNSGCQITPRLNMIPREESSRPTVTTVTKTAFRNTPTTKTTIPNIAKTTTNTRVFQMRATRPRRNYIHSEMEAIYRAYRHYYSTTSQPPHHIQSVHSETFGIYRRN